jgi:EAL domain-containing protein (putative c-di-GMP-specific phosphodiesterase class I)
VYSLEGEFATITLSAGIAVCSNPDESGETLLDHATQAARFAKMANSKGEFRFFTNEMNAHIHERFMLEGDLRRALQEGGQLFLLYQPQVDLTTHQVIGVEALVRWRHPIQGVLSPVQFIPVAEESGLILALGEWVLRAAITQAAEWQQAGAPLRMAVNLSAVQFNQIQLVEQVQDVLAEAKLSPKLLELEITETSLMDNVPQAISHLKKLSELGVQLALDDFGTGYSSLSYVQQFALNRLKIDQSFVRDLTAENAPDSNPENRESNPGKAARTIVSAIVGLAHNLGLEVIAEGVETAAQLDCLVRMECDEYQGFFCSPPVAADEGPGIIIRQQTAPEIKPSPV